MTRNVHMPAFTPATFADIAEDIEESISSHSRAQLDGLQEQLAEYFTDLVRTASESVVDAVRGVLPEDAPEVQAFVLGKVTFAQLVAAQAAERRADDQFMDNLHLPKYKKYIVALEHEDLNGIQLARITGDREETVSRKLRELRKFGIVDFRKNGTSVINFLTPIARAAYSPDLGFQRGVADEIIMAALHKLPRELQGSRNFASTTTPVAVDV